MNNKLTKIKKQLNDILEYGIETSLMLEDEDSRITSLIKLAGYYIDINYLQKAEELLNLAYNLISNIKEDNTDSEKQRKLWTLQPLLKCYMKLNKSTEIDKLINEMYELVMSIKDEPDRSIELSLFVSEVLLKVDNIDLAIEVCEKITKNFFKTHTYVEIAGKFLELSRKYPKYGYMNKYVTYLQKAYKTAQQVDNPYDRVDLLVRIANAYIDLTYVDEAKEVIEDAIRTTYQTHYDFRTINDLFNVIAVLIRLYNLEVK